MITDIALSDVKQNTVSDGFDRFLKKLLLRVEEKIPLLYCLKGCRLCALSQLKKAQFQARFLLSSKLMCDSWK